MSNHDNIKCEGRFTGIVRWVKHGRWITIRGNIIQGIPQRVEYIPPHWWMDAGAVIKYVTFGPIGIHKANCILCGYDYAADDEKEL